MSAFKAHAPLAKLFLGLTLGATWGCEVEPQDELRSKLAEQSWVVSRFHYESEEGEDVILTEADCPLQYSTFNQPGSTHRFELGDGDEDRLTMDSPCRPEDPIVIYVEWGASTEWYEMIDSGFAPNGVTSFDSARDALLWTPGHDGFLPGRFIQYEGAIEVHLPDGDWYELVPAGPKK